MQIYIHIGPPKTGTSAIQKWLSNNTDFLKQNDIFYPQHETDENGVSSGNVLNIFERTVDKKLLLLTQKVEKVLTDCKAAGCTILLLSSEFFFFQITELLSVFPNAQFITYIRFPLDVIESSYNQSVKRHSEVRALGIAEEPQAYHLRQLELMLDKYTQAPFIIRFYSNEVFYKGDIVCDFLSIFDVESEPTQQIVNPSYNFESLEVKRWLNQFLMPEYQDRVDGFLQSLSSETNLYSLVQPKKYAYFKTFFIDKLQMFFDKYSVDNSSKYLEQIKAKQQKSFKPQNLNIDDFRSVMHKMASYDSGLVYGLAQLAKSRSSLIVKRTEFIDVLKSSIPKKFLYRTALRERYFAFKYYIKKFYLFKTRRVPNDINIPVTDSMRIRHALSINNEVSDAEIFRELALYCEQNGEIQFAYRLMKEANSLRPGGPVISAKLAEYQEHLNLRPEPEFKKK
ncbi:sulfotransferase [Paraglaciecola sp. 2405UD69-4]|uniref:sulfotransferase n=1 Tax=Paraglaciecola sp. 2405UD69-4 TaxID=3391836 RepID=UPI0039C98111